MLECPHQQKKIRVAIVGTKVFYVKMCYDCYEKYVTLNGFVGSVTSIENINDNYYINNQNDDATKRYEDSQIRNNRKLL